jgi:ABC-type uncharacterized transport system permease subunit
MAVALVILARWNPLRRIFAACLFGALGPALQAVGISQSYRCFKAAPLARFPPTRCRG